MRDNACSSRFFTPVTYKLSTRSRIFACASVGSADAPQFAKHAHVEQQIIQFIQVNRDG